MARRKISRLPGGGRGSGKLVGILTNRDMRFDTDPNRTAAELMTTGDLITVREGAGQDEARELLRTRKIERVIVVDEDYRAVGLITMKDIEKAQAYPHAAKDEQGRLLVGAASTVGDAGFERSMALVDAGVRRGGHRHRPRPLGPGRRVGRAHQAREQPGPDHRRQRRHL